MASQSTSLSSVNPVRTPPRLTNSPQWFKYDTSISRRRALGNTIILLMGIALISGGDLFLRSYKYYARVIDARLARGYLTARPGIYAAPRIIQRRQKLTPADLVRSLRRAGYVESDGSNVWSGAFRANKLSVDIRTQRDRSAGPKAVTVSFDESQHVSEISADGSTIDRFVLEPETLANDPSYKSGQHEPLSFSEIPTSLVHAVTSIEDQRFFDHSGLDAVGIARALASNLDHERVGQGGSTITQQLVKNTYLSPERTLKRKYAEAMLALALERRLSKQDIFALYCNEIYLGQRGAVAARGFREAAKLYFNKDLRQLSLSETATLAGMIQSPGHYSPLKHVEAARARRNVVLGAMAANNFITSAELESAIKEPITVSSAVGASSTAPYFVDFVNRSSDSENNANSQRIYTTIDLDLQELAERALAHQLDKLNSTSTHRKARPQVAMVALDPSNGNVLAMVGGRDYAGSQLNRATDARRQPGSTFKPFVYAAALEDGMSPVRMFDDSPREFTYDRNKIYRPQNFGGGYSMHDVTMRTALVKSLNVVTIDVALQTGLARIANLASDFGLPKPERLPSLALGTKEVTPLELASAYATFVNGGRRVYPRVVASVGDPPATHSSSSTSSQSQVISPTTAYMITNMLSAVVDHGTARAARDLVKTTAIAGKTGTSRDGWFVGYTPHLVCVVWIGFDDNQQLGLTGADAALPAWTEFIKAAVDLKPELGGRNFECPEGIKFVEVDADDGSLATLSCPHRELIAVTAALAPNVECYLHRHFQDVPVETPTSFEIGPNDMVAHHRDPNRPRKLILQLSPGKYFPTRVDVGAGGKRTLVNDLR
jgi:penicillin-binding protein 1B